MHFRQDVLSGFGPDERFRSGIVMAEVLVNRLNELGDAAEDPTANAPRCEVAEPAFDQVEPGTRRRDEVQVEPRMPAHPPMHGGMLVSRVIIQDQMQVERSRCLGIDLLQEPEKLVMPMAWPAVADDRAVEQTQSREERRGAVAFVIMGHRATPTVFQREARLGAVQGLDLTFFIHAEDESMRGRIQIQAHYIRHLLLKLWVATQLEWADPMGFEAMRGPYPLHQRGIGPQVSG